MQQIAVSIADAARSLGVGRSTIYELLRTEKLESFKIGRRTLVTTSSITRLAGAAKQAQ
jgi:excisionase family DNA binding protein